MATTSKKPVAKKGAKKAAAKKNPAEKRAKKASMKTPDVNKPSGPQYWLFKSEPFKFSWEMLKAKGKKGEQWDGVRNYLARNNMRAMKLGDLGFFYHSNEGLEVVGICEVCALAHPDSTTDDERWECVDVRAVVDVPKPVKLAEVKANEKLADMALVTSMRLSVQPVKPDEWKEVLRMGGLTQKAIKDALGK